MGRAMHAALPSWPVKMAIRACADRTAAMRHAAVCKTNLLLSQALTAALEAIVSLASCAMHASLADPDCGRRQVGLQATGLAVVDQFVGMMEALTFGCTLSIQACVHIRHTCTKGIRILPRQAGRQVCRQAGRE